MKFPFSLLSNLSPGFLLSAMSGARRTTVVVPVFNGGPAVADCLAALLNHTEHDDRILVIDDGSSDPEIVALLDSVATTGRIELIRHESNMGYTRTVNHGIREAGADDVVLLNSDTRVGPQWLTRLRWVLHSQERVATVSAVSDWAGTMSIPKPHQHNVWHQSAEWDAIARHVMHGMQVWSQEVPAAHGFCMMIKREAVDEVGSFDEQSFPFGYGEEVDFSQRLIAAGWMNLVAPHVIVHHARSQSFGADRRKELVMQSRPILAKRYPRLRQDVHDWETSVGDRLIRIAARRLQYSRADALPRSIDIREHAGSRFIGLMEGGKSLPPKLPVVGDRKVEKTAIVEFLVANAVESATSLDAEQAVTEDVMSVARTLRLTD